MNPIGMCLNTELIYPQRDNLIARLRNGDTSVARQIAVIEGAYDWRGKLDIESIIAKYTRI